MKDELFPWYRKMNLAGAFALSVLIGTGAASSVFAASTANFTQTINSGTLAVNIVDGSYAPVASPSVALGAVTFSFNCQSSTGSFGTSTQQIYVSNPDAADNGWSVAVAASSPTAFWDGAGSDFDFNDGASSGCADGVDADSLNGQMTVNPAAGTLAIGSCASCATTSVTKGSSSAFVQGTTDSITVLTGAAGSNDIGDWTLQGVSVSQTIPAEQAAAGDYAIDLTLSITAS